MAASAFSAADASSTLRATSRMDVAASGDVVAVAGVREVKLFRPDGTTIRKLDVDGEVLSVSVRSDGAEVVVACRRGAKDAFAHAVEVLVVKTGIDETLAEARGAERQWVGVKFAPVGDLLGVLFTRSHFSIFRNGVQVWRKELVAPAATGVVWSADGASVGVVREVSKDPVRVSFISWRAGDGEEPREFEISCAHPFAARVVAASLTLAATLSSDLKLRLFDEGGCVAEFLHGASDGAASISSDGAGVAAVGPSGSVRAYRRGGEEWKFVAAAELSGRDTLVDHTIRRPLKPSTPGRASFPGLSARPELAVARGREGVCAAVGSRVVFVPWGDFSKVCGGGGGVMMTRQAQKKLNEEVSCATALLTPPPLPH
jgi:hypothetical protein